MRKYRIFSGITVLLLSLCMVLTACGGGNDQLKSESRAEETLSESPQLFDSSDPVELIPQNPAKRGYETVLFIGLDKFEASVEEMAYLNDQQCDFLLLLVIDEENGVCDILHLNRDTMTEITRLGIGSKKAGTFVGQLALAHTYGSGGSDSCLNTTRAVSKLLKGVPIDHYIAMTMEGVSTLNDLVGGVPVTIPVDMTHIDPSFWKGAEVVLHGDHALDFVRTRMDTGDGSNLSRMERQRAYLDSLYRCLMESIKEDDSFIDSSLLKMTAHFQSDLPLTSLDDLCERLASCKVNPFTVIEGEAVAGEEFMEFYVDEESLDQVINDLFIR